MARSSVGALATAEELGGVEDAGNGAKLLKKKKGKQRASRMRVTRDRNNRYYLHKTRTEKENLQTGH
jgi:hypothetical protein